MSERIKEYAIIRRATNQEVYRTQINKGSFVRYELMKSHYIQLNFSTARAIYFRLGDYCITEYGIFELTEQYLPTYNNRTGGYDYQLTLNADYWKWDNKTLLFLPLNNRFETSWTLTDTIDKHLALITNNIRYHGYLHNNSFYEVSIQQGVDIESAKMITYDGVHIIEALNNICKEFDCEWWVEGNIIYIGRCEHGSAVDFELDVNVEKMVASEGAGNHATRIYPFGSTQNMPKDYRQGNEGVVVNGIAESRVMLPSNYPTPYVQHPDVATEEEAVEAVVIFEEVYPHTDGTMTTVTSDMKNLDDGNGGTEQARIYRFKDSGLTFKSDYELEQLQIIIQSGTMRGMTFDVIFNPDRKAEMIDDGEGNMVANPEAQVFEIVRNDTYGPMLPNDDINPQKDIQAGRTVKYRLIGWDASKMQEMGLVAAAELELQEKAEAYAEKLQMDSSTYTCTMNSDWAYGLDEHGQADSTNSHRYDIGQKVRLVNGNFFKDGSRVSRIVGFELKLDFEYDHPQYFVGEAPDYSRFGDIESKIDAITFKSTNYMAATNMGSGGASVYVIGTGDVTPPTDGNVFSARRSLQQFVRRDKDDTISGLHIYQRSTSAERGIQSSDFNPGVFGTGFTVKRKPSGRTVMETDELIVRIKAFFANLEIRELSYVGGNYLFSCAGSKLLRVEWYDENDELLEQTPANQFLVSYFRCYFYQDNGTTATMNYWMVGDQARCQKFNIKPGVYQNITNKYYWRLVVGKGDDYVDLSATDCDFDSDIPEAEDSIVQLGFRGENNSRRQGCIFLDVESENSPAIYEYSGITSYQLPEPTLQLSPKKNIIYGEFHSISDGSGGNVDTRTLQEQILALLAEINAIKNQADKKFEIWFGHGVPTANNYPAEDWTTDELKALHEQDIYYDVDRSPGSRGGRAYRWVAVHTGEEPNIVTTYQWMEITDQDTIDALEKIADVASDEMLTGGAEKTRVLVDWCKAEHEYWKYTEQARDYGLNDANYYAQGETNVYNAYVTAFLALGRYLNGDTDLTLASAGVYNTPSWLAGANLQADTPIESPAQYRLVWNNYYLTLATLLKAITKRAKELADAAQADATAALNNLEKIASDGWLMPDEKIEVRREFVAAYQEMNDEGGILDKAMDDRGSYNYINYNTHIKPYKDAFNALGTYLNGGTTWTSPAIDPDDVTETAWILPEWIDDDHMGTGVQINGDTFCSLWATFYSARTVVLTELSKNAQTTATEAHGRVDDIVSDGVISAGSEKSLLYIDWLKTVAEYWKYMEQAGDYTDPVGTENRYVVNTTAFTTAFTELATMLNNGVTATERILAGTDRPSWLDADHINANTELANTPILTADAYRTKWKNYSTALTALLEVITKRAKELADAAQADATAALSKISDMANDGKLVPDEKLTVKREFLAAWHERDDEGGILDKCKTPSAENPNVQVYINDTIEAAYVTPYLNAFKAVGSYLNGRSNNNPVTWNGITITSSTTDAQIEDAMPAWLKEAAMSTTNDIDGDDWRNVWATFYSARTALLTALSEDAKDRADEAQQTADDAQDEIDQITADSVLSRIEKKQVRKEFEAIIRNKQYNLILATQFDVANSDYGTDSNGNSIVTQYTTAYNNLGKYLNGDFESGSSSNWTADTVPAWLADLTSDQEIVPNTYRTYWVNYYDKENALLNAISSIAKKSGDDALAKLQDIASDGKITPSEKNTLLINWREVVTEYPIIITQSNAYTNILESGTLRTNLQTATTNYIQAFNTLATILNNGTTYSYTLDPANFPTPSWIGTRLSITEELTAQQKTNFNNAWDAYYNKRTTLQDIFVDVAKKPGDDALGELDNLAADNILTEFEKLTTLREWDAARTEHTDLVTKAQYAHVSYSAYENAYYKLGNYLVDLTINGTVSRQGNTVHNKTIDGETYNFSVDYANPLMLCYISGNTNISGSTFKEYWSAYYDERSKLLSAIANHHINIFTGDSNPTPPYSVGDYWIKSDNSEWVCVYPRGIGESYNSSDWRDMRDITEKRDPRVVLAGFGEKTYPLISSYISGSYVTAFWDSSTPQNYNNGDIWYNGSTVYQRISGSWVENTSVIVKGAFVAVDGVLDVMNRTSIRLYGTRQNISPSKYDLFLHTITYTDPYLDNNNQYKTLESGVEILMYNGDNDWETLRESVRSVIDKLNDYIRMIVFGTTNGNLTASGAVVKSDFVSMFATAVDANGHTITEAYLSAFVTQDANGYLQSGVKIQADQIEIDGNDRLSLSLLGSAGVQVMESGYSYLNWTRSAGSSGSDMRSLTAYTDLPIITKQPIPPLYIKASCHISYDEITGASGLLQFSISFTDSNGVSRSISVTKQPERKKDADGNDVTDSNGRYVYKAFNGTVEAFLILDVNIRSINSVTYYHALYNYNSTSVQATMSQPSLIVRSKAAAIERTGIDIEQGKITLRGDNIIFANSDGTITGRIWIDPTAGTLHATNAVIQNSELTNVKVSGVIANPFVVENSTMSWIDGKTYYAAMSHDNLLYNSATHYLYWNAECSGRLITLCHHESVTGNTTFNAPEGMYFYEDGMKRSSITLSRQCVILKGYGTASTFFGYIVVGRIDLAPTRSYGHALKCLAFGTIKYNNSEVTVQEKTFDGRTFTCSRIDKGIYQVNIPTAWNIASGQLFVMATALSDIAGGGNPLYAGVREYKESSNVVTGFVVQCGDDASRNDGDVQFMLYNKGDWDTI